MNTRYIRTFDTVVRLGSFSQAAKVLNLSQPAVTLQIKSLEEDLGVQLLCRDRHPPRLTPNGALIIGYLRVCVESYETARETAAAADGPTGQLAVAAAYALGEFLIPFLAHQCACQPAFRGLRTIISHHDEIIRVVKAGEADLGIVGLSPADIKGLGNISYSLLGEDEILPVVAPGHGLAARGSVSLREVMKEQLILRDFSTPARWEVDRALRALRVGRGELVVMTVGSNEAVKLAVQAGMGMGFVSKFSVAKELQQGTLVCLSIVGTVMRRPIHALYSPHGARVGLVRQLIALIQPLLLSAGPQRSSAAPL